MRLLGARSRCSLIQQERAYAHAERHHQGPGQQRRAPEPECRR